MNKVQELRKKMHYKEDCKENPNYDTDSKNTILTSTILRDLIMYENRRIQQSHKDPFEIFKLIDLQDCNVILFYKNEEKNCVWTLEKHQNVKRGSNAAVYQSCCDEKCDYAVKIDTNGYNCNEVNSHIKMSVIEVAPKLYEVWKCVGLDGITKFTILIMDRLEKTLYEYLTDNTTSQVDANTVISKIPDLITKMFNGGVTHNDLHLENFMLDKSNNLYIIDYGWSNPATGIIPSDDYKVMAEHLHEANIIRVLQNIENVNRTRKLYTLVEQYYKELQREKGRSVTIGKKKIEKDEIKKSSFISPQQHLPQLPLPQWVTNNLGTCPLDSINTKIVNMINKKLETEFIVEENDIATFLEKYTKNLSDDCKYTLFKYIKDIHLPKKDIHLPKE